MSFGDDIRRFNRKTDDDLLKTFRGTFLSLSAKIVQRTPVDTGRAAANFIIGIGKPEKLRFLTLFNKSRSPRSGNIQKLKKLKEGEAVFINNNLKYIQALERRHNTNPHKRSFLREKSKGFMVRGSLAILPLELKSKGIKIKITASMDSGV